MSEEVWKAVPGYKGIYEASNLGRIRSLDRTGVDGRTLHGRILSERPGDIGYPTCVLCKNGKYVPTLTHRVIALTFLDPPDNSFTTHHKNGVRTDNRVENLEIRTFSGHARYHLLKNPLDNRGSRNGQSRLTADIVRAIRREYATGNILQRELAERYAISRSHVSGIITRKYWTHI